MDLHNCVFHGIGKRKGNEYKNSSCTCTLITSCYGRKNSYSFDSRTCYSQDAQSGPKPRVINNNGARDVTCSCDLCCFRDRNLPQSKQHTLKCLLYHECSFDITKTGLDMLHRNIFQNFGTNMVLVLRCSNNKTSNLLDVHTTHNCGDVTLTLPTRDDFKEPYLYKRV